jgi:hypothetical protein
MHGHEFNFTFITIILVSKNYLFILYIHNTMIGDSYLVRISAEIFDNMLRTSKRSLGIDYPV